MNKITYLFLITTTIQIQISEQTTIQSQSCFLQTPVCGINRITYKNPCLCQQAKVKIAYYTACLQKTVTNQCHQNTPVCGLDGKTYQNACICSKYNIQIAYNSACKTQIHHQMLNCEQNKPVCGYNNKTYQNACICKRSNIQIAYYTACKTQIAKIEMNGCDQDFPVCGYDKRTYRNSCLCKKAQVQIAYYTACRSVLRNDHFHDCRANLPVCGYDHKTYPNPCLCKKAGVQIAYRTSCVVRRNYLDVENGGKLFNGSNKDWLKDNFYYQNFKKPVFEENYFGGQVHQSSYGLLGNQVNHVHVGPAGAVNEIIQENPIMVGNSLDE